LSACTNACTSEPETVHGSTLEGLAAQLLNLSPEDRAKLAAILGSADVTKAGRGECGDTTDKRVQ
jgi:hypothetical protein